MVRKSVYDALEGNRRCHHAQKTLLIPACTRPSKVVQRQSAGQIVGRDAASLIFSLSQVGQLNIEVLGHRAQPWGAETRARTVAKHFSAEPV